MRTLLSFSSVKGAYYCTYYPSYVYALLLRNLQTRQNTFVPKPKKKKKNMVENRMKTYLNQRSPPCGLGIGYRRNDGGFGPRMCKNQSECRGLAERIIVLGPDHGFSQISSLLLGLERFFDAWEHSVPRLDAFDELNYLSLEHTKLLSLFFLGSSRTFFPTRLLIGRVVDV